MSERESYLAQLARFEKERLAAEDPWVQGIREAASARFAEIGFPTTREEQWRYTDVAPIARTSFVPLRDGEAEGRRLIEASGHLPAADGEGHRLVFVNGRYARELSRPGSVPRGAVVGSLSAAMADHRDLVEPHLARHVEYRDHAFVALNTAFFTDGVFVFLPPGVALDGPLHAVFVSISNGGPGVAHPRSLVVAGPSSTVTVVESHVGAGAAPYWSNVVTEIVAGPDSVVDHYTFERQSDDAFHLGSLHIQQSRNSTVRARSLSLGGGLVRNDSTVVLDGEGSGCTLDGLYMLGGRQHVDNRTAIDHVRPRCSSRETYKGVLDGRATGAFYGKIRVHPDAQRTDARQTNQTLLLSEEAVMNTRPQLEIFADDVKCAHGAAVGHLDEDAVFYLRSRGIDPERARSLLTYGFVSEILSGIEVEPLRALLESLIAARLEAGPAARDAG